MPTIYTGPLTIVENGEEIVFHPETESDLIIDLEDYLDTWLETKTSTP